MTDCLAYTLEDMSDDWFRLVVAGARRPRVFPLFDFVEHVTGARQRRLERALRNERVLPSVPLALT